MMPVRRATICLLTYGDYLDFFRRCLVTVDRHTPHEQIELRLGFNDAPKSLCYALGRLLPSWEMPRPDPLPGGGERLTFADAGGMPVRIWNSPVNLFKEPMCRLLYYDVPVTTDYVVWLDDDSFVEPGWWEALLRLLDRSIDYIGQPWWVTYLPGQTEMICHQSWYREVPFDERNGQAGTWFMTGGFMAVRTECLRQANFPDTDSTWKDDRLKQYGGDTLLGEIARQLGWTRAAHDKHVKVNVDLEGQHPAPRRGGTGRQFGSDVDVIIR
jgi:hypothetical protein